MTYIHYQRGDIFTSQAQVLVNTVNCKGVMGKGLALAFKQKFPAMFPIYQQECKTGRLRIGRPTLFKASTPWVLNFPTKDNWKANSKLEYLEKGLEYFVQNYKQVGIKSIAFPKLGAQNGKLSWDDVGPLMAKYLSSTDIDVYIYITDEDKEYQYDQGVEEKLRIVSWQRFNELALSAERLRQEIGLNPKDAKYIADQRAIQEFTSQVDIDSIEKLAKITRQRIRAYISNQRFLVQQLPGMTTETSTSSMLITNDKPKRRPTNTQSKAKKSQSVATQNNISLFTA